MNYAIMEADTVDFDPQRRRKDLHFLKQPYAASIYSVRTTTTGVSQTRKAPSLLSQSVQNQIILKKADLAAKKAESNGKISKENKQKEINMMEEERKRIEKAIDQKKREAEIIMLETECEVASARVKVMEEASNTTPPTLGHPRP